MRNFDFNDNSLDVNNPAPRCPVILMLDKSSSMCGQPIQELNEGLRQFVRETSADEAASMSVELEVITFDNSAQVLVPFKPICDVAENVPVLIADGMTCMGAALRLATRHLNDRRRLYRQNGISSYKPWVILMTDGCPNDDWQTSAEEMRRKGEAGKIQYVGIEIGNSVNHTIMCQILPPPGPVKLRGLRFKQFFKWLTDSLRSVSASAVSEEDDVKFGSIRTWADIPDMD